MGSLHLLIFLPWMGYPQVCMWLLPCMNVTSSEGLLWATHWTQHPGHSLSLSFPASTFITLYFFANLFVLSPTIYEFHESRPCLFLLSCIYHSAWKSVNIYAQGDRHTDFCCSTFSYKQKWPKYLSTEWWTMDYGINIFTYGPYTLHTAYHYCTSLNEK